MKSFKEYHKILKEDSIDVSFLSSENQKEFRKWFMKNSEATEEEQKEYANSLQKQAGSASDEEISAAGAEREIPRKRKIIIKKKQEETEPETEEEFDEDPEDNLPDVNELLKKTNLSENNANAIRWFAKNIDKLKYIASSLSSYKQGTNEDIKRALGPAAQGDNFFKFLKNHPELKNKPDLIKQLYSTTIGQETDPNKLKERKDAFYKFLSELMPISTIWQYAIVGNGLNRSNYRLDPASNFATLAEKALGNRRDLFIKIRDLFAEEGGKVSYLLNLPDIEAFKDIQNETLDFKQIVKTYLDKILPQQKQQTAKTTIEKNENTNIKSNNSKGNADSSISSGSDTGNRTTGGVQKTETDGAKGNTENDTTNTSRTEASSTKNIPFNVDAYKAEIERLADEALEKVQQESILKKVCKEVIAEAIPVVPLVAAGAAAAAKPLSRYVTRTLRNEGSMKYLTDQVIAKTSQKIKVAKEKALHKIEKAFQILDPETITTRSQRSKAKIDISKAMSEFRIEMIQQQQNRRERTQATELNLAGRAIRDTGKNVVKGLRDSYLGKKIADKVSVLKQKHDENKEANTARLLQDASDKSGPYYPRIKAALEDGFNRQKTIDQDITIEKYLSNRASAFNLTLNTREGDDNKESGIGVIKFNNLGQFYDKLGPLSERLLKNISAEFQQGKQQTQQQPQQATSPNTQQQQTQAQPQQQATNFTLADFKKGLAEVPSDVNKSNYNEFFAALSKTNSLKGLTQEQYKQLYDEYAEETAKDSVNKQTGTTGQTPNQATASVTTDAVGTIFPHRILSKEIRRRLKQ